ncbi:PEGA domain-containing protein [Sorangium atrum]|uniref:PEGA domain-containing protein n=1 Tax=Sorangium atrum TaxID=2995308 RepID=A0ABT5C9N7_9BACT|nr:PEGA domain-containing protein [Sorangium aterium]MDC0683149.1 PEGA domain-containing protein [Sorangium aterium]
MMRNRPLPWTLSVVIALLAPAAEAQPAPPRAEAQESDALTDRARQLFADGVKAANAGKWAEAHAAFLAAWGLKPHYQIASNLGVACLRVGKPRDAAEYLTRYLREVPATKVQERQRAEVSLQEARAQVAAVTVEVAPGGAEVTVDGAIVGRAPLADPVFLDPGRHEVGAKLDGYVSQTRPVDAPAGGTETVVIALERPPAPDARGAGAERSASPAPGVSQGGGRTAVLVGGGIATGVGTVAGVVFTLVANGKASDAARQNSVIDAMEAGSVNCATPAGSDQKQQCSKLRSLVDDQYLFSNLALWSFIGAGASAVGTLGYTWLAGAPSEPEQRVHLFPLVMPGGGGLVAGGVF